MKITNLKVPSVYVLGSPENGDHLVLDCEYEVGKDEKGFVLKWWLNEHQIYQWIASNPQPHSMVRYIPNKYTYNTMRFLLTIYNIIFD